MRASLVLALLAACSNSDGGLKAYNSAPSVTIQNPVSGATYNEGEILTFEAKASDAQSPSDALTTQWVSDLDGVLSEGAPDASGRVTFSTSSLKVGAHTITLYVTDEDALEGYDTTAISIIDLPEPPTLAVESPTSGDEALEGDAVEYTAKVGDAQDAASDLYVWFESDIDETFCEPVPDTSGYASCLEKLSPGKHFLTYSVRDTAGNVASDTLVFTVIALNEYDNDGDGWTEEQGDCNDADATVRPGAGETEDGVDNDCDGQIDEGTNSYDDDGDGYAEVDDDCDDDDPEVNPGAREDCGTAYDDDCNGSLNDEGATSCVTYYYDYDGDGFGSSSVTGRCLCSLDGYYTSAQNTDCYDYNAAANPGASTYATSSRGDGSFDWNCDGAETKYWPDKGSCSFNVDFSNFCEMTVGWSGSVAACGVTGDYATDCDGYYEFPATFDCDLVTYKQQQSCL